MDSTLLQSKLMRNARDRRFSLMCVAACLWVANACTDGRSASHHEPIVEFAPSNTWTRVTDDAEFPGSYNFPVFTVGHQMWAFHPAGNWSSGDGKAWTMSELPTLGAKPGHQRHVQFNDAVYLLGTVEGDYPHLRLGSRIARTTDFKKWEVLADSSNLPERVFYKTVVFKGKIWLMGGSDGRNYFNDVWNSADGVHWVRVADTTAWTPRTIDVAVVFKNKIWIIGGGVIDGEPTNNPHSGAEIWSSGDGVKWTQASDAMVPQYGASPIVFNDKLWLVGANRDGSFTKAVLVSEDGVAWREQTAPWTPRGGVATWIFGDKLYMTGGKFSAEVNGELSFIYSNDVWAMTD
ncbi:MAG: hypothetical protein K8R92_09120 [Planctomycetes bacterium]|nr:hypothetical protein [Planctomycetota bacterium]